MKHLYLLLFVFIAFPLLMNAQKEDAPKEMHIDILLLKDYEPKFQLGVEFGTEFFLPQTKEINHVEGFRYNTLVTPSAMVKLKYSPYYRWFIIGGVGIAQRNFKEHYYCYICDLEEDAPIARHHPIFMDVTLQAQFKQRVCFGDLYATAGVQYSRLVGGKSQYRWSDESQLEYDADWAINKNNIAAIASVGWAKRICSKLEIGADLGYAYYFQSTVNQYWFKRPYETRQDMNLQSLRANVGLYYRL